MGKMLVAFSNLAQLERTLKIKPLLFPFLNQPPVPRPPPNSTPNRSIEGAEPTGTALHPPKAESGRERGELTAHKGRGCEARGEPGGRGGALATRSAGIKGRGSDSWALGRGRDGEGCQEAPRINIKEPTPPLHLPPTPSERSGNKFGIKEVKTACGISLSSRTAKRLGFLGAMIPLSGRAVYGARRKGGGGGPTCRNAE